jgi:hypothetical protein
LIKGVRRHCAQRASLAATLPDAVMRLIFVEAASAHDAPFGIALDARVLLVCISAVCRAWRRAACDLPMGAWRSLCWHGGSFMPDRVLKRIGGHVQSLVCSGVHHPQCPISAPNFEAFAALRCLELRHTDGATVVAALACLPNAPSLRTLRLPRNGLDAQAVRAISDFLGRCVALRELDVSCNPLRCDGVRELCTAIGALPRLVRLSVARCGIRAEGADALAAAFAHGLPQLRFVDHVGNVIDVEHASTILRALQH